MIISQTEVLKVIDLMDSSAVIANLLASGSRSGVDDTVRSPISRATATDGPSYRQGRVADLRRLFASGEYSVAPLDVADKMLGRAFCDQMARMYDR